MRTFKNNKELQANTHRFIDEDVSDCLLEIGLLMIIVKDDILLSEEDFSDDECAEEFSNKFTELLKSSPNILSKAAADYFDCEGFESMTEENIFDFFSA